MERREVLRGEAELEKAVQKLTEELRSGIEHGFFECTVTCEIVNSRKRRVTIRAGKKYQYIVSEEELRG